MNGKTKYIIRVSNEERQTISELLDMLDACPIDLSNQNYIEIIREIANGGTDTGDIEWVEIQYKD